MDTHWKYEAIFDGRRMTGEVIAPTERDAETIIRQMGIENFKMLSNGGQEAEIALTNHNKEELPKNYVLGETPFALPTKAGKLPAFDHEDMKRTMSSMSKKTQRRQCILIGDSGKIMKDSQHLLEQNGVVVHTNMHPDAQGKMVFLIVIDHELKEKN